MSALIYLAPLTKASMSSTWCQIADGSAKGTIARTGVEIKKGVQVSYSGLEIGIEIFPFNVLDRTAPGGFGWRRLRCRVVVVVWRCRRLHCWLRLHCMKTFFFFCGKTRECVFEGCLCTRFRERYWAICSYMSTFLPRHSMYADSRLSLLPRAWCGSVI